MKKIQVILATLAIASFSFGASVDWQCWDIVAKGATPTYSGGYLQSGGLAEGSIAFLIECASDFDTSTIISAVEKNTFDYGTALASATVDGYFSIEKKGNGDYSAGTSQSFYMIVFDTASVADGSNFKVSAVQTVAFETGDPAIDFTDSIGAASWNTVAVPEPTTVALLALGLAALGMKRKVA